MALESIDTPALVVDLDALDANIRRMAQVASSHGVHLRPHAKSHKCPAIALRQVASGAVGICCQKVGEAEVMAQSGIKDILLSNEVWGSTKLERLAALARQVRIAVCVDDAQNVADLSAAADTYGVDIDVLVEINVVEDARCGVTAGEPARRLAKSVAGSQGLRFAGLQAYAGRAQHTRDNSERESAVQNAVQLVTTTKTLLERDGLACPWITGSGTGTYNLEASSGIYTELQPGSYIFMDVDYGRNRTADGSSYGDFQQSLFIYSTVMSRQSEAAGVLDAGIKSSSFDSGPPTVCGVDDANLVRGEDEHLVVIASGGHFPYGLGDKVRLIPGHCDPTVNLYDWYIGVRNDRVEAIWPVAARGRNR
jgi:D-serine deaminase-like pyridoxal phosphate-dependent protein